MTRRACPYCGQPLYDETVCRICSRIVEPNPWRWLIVLLVAGALGYAASWLWQPAWTFWTDY